MLDWTQDLDWGCLPLVDVVVDAFPEREALGHEDLA